jgi:hypothetical protein
MNESKVKKHSRSLHARGNEFEERIEAFDILVRLKEFPLFDTSVDLEKDAHIKSISFQSSLARNENT